MFPDLDKSSAFIARSSFKEKSLDICGGDSLKYAALYEELLSKKDSIDNMEYQAAAHFPVPDGGVVNIRHLLPLDGMKFTNTAYVTILGRMPDKDAAAAYMNTLSADSSKETKTKLLTELSESAEAKQRWNFALTGFDSIDINELYKYSDREFIEKAYISIIFRRPDAEGENYFLSLLRSPDYSAAEILYMLRHSPEGEKNGVNVIGLDEEYNNRIKRKKLMNTPLLGKCGRYAYDLLRTNRRINELKQENYCLKDMLNSGKAHIDGSLNRLEMQTMTASAAAGRTEELSTRMGSAEQRLNGLEAYVTHVGNNVTGLNELSSSAEKRAEAYEKAFKELDAFVHRLGDNVTRLNSGFDEHGNHLNELSSSAEKRAEAYEKAFKELDAFVHRIGDNVNNLNKGFEEHGNHLNELDAYAHSIGDNVNSLNKGHSEHGNHLNELSAAVTKLAEDAHKRTESFERSYRELDGYVHQIGDNVAELNKAMENHDKILSGDKGEDSKTVQMLLSEVFSLKARINALERNASAAVKASDDTAAAVSPSAVSPDVYSSIDYFDFENHFRGSREHVKSVQKIYIPYFEGKKNVLDLGCGRGEFTELLKENNIGVTGVDMYEPYVEYMRSLKLPAVLDDAAEYLRRQESTDGIFMGQVVEHISVDKIAEICSMAYEKLEKGCCLIMETPNPRSLAIYYSAFYIDPSHQKPVHPLTLKYIAEKAGFSEVEILYTESSKPPFSIPKLKENEPDFKAFNEAMQKVSELLYGSQDYAVIARK